MRIDVRWSELMMSFFILVMMLSQGCTQCDRSGRNRFLLSSSDSLYILTTKAAHLIPENMDSAKIFLDLAVRYQDVTSDSGKAEFFNTYGLYYWYSKAYDSAIQKFSKTLQFADDPQVKSKMAPAANNIGALYNKLGKPDSARKYLNIALQTDTELGNDYGRTKTLYDLALLHLRTDQYLIALKYINKVLDFQENTRDSVRLVYSYSVIGNIYMHLDSIRKAVTMFERSAEIAHKINREPQVVQAFNNIAAAWVRKGDCPDCAIDFAQRGLVIAGKLDLYLHLLSLNLNLGAAYSIKKQHRRALQYYLQGYSYYDSVEQPLNKLQLLIHLADEYAVLDQPQKSRELYNLALTEALEIQSLAIQRNAWLGLAHLDSLAGNFDMAYKNFRQGIAIRDSISNKDLSARIIELQYLYNLSEKTTRIAELEQKDKYNRLLMHSGLLIFAATAIGVFFFVLNLRKKRKITQQRLIIQQTENEKSRVIIDAGKKELTNMALSLMKSEKLINDLKSEIEKFADSKTHSANDLAEFLDSMKKTGFSQKSWVEFEERFNQINNRFISRLYSDFPALSPSEIRLCALIRLQLSSKEIAVMSHRSLRTIEYTRNNIRKKLGLKTTDNLAAFLLSF